MSRTYLCEYNVCANKYRYIKLVLHLQLDRRKSAKQNVYDGLGNFPDRSVDIVKFQSHLAEYFSDCLR